MLLSPDRLDPAKDDRTRQMVTLNSEFICKHLVKFYVETFFFLC